MALIVRGLPGSGKTSLASWIAKLVEQNFWIVKRYSLDNYRLDAAGNYRYVPEENESIAAKMYEEMKKDLTVSLTLNAPRGVLVIVDNSHAREWEFERSRDILSAEGFTIHVIECQRPLDECLAANTHGVPEEVFQKMVAVWERWHERPREL